MDDNELDKLFGTDSKADKAADETAGSSDKGSEKNEPEKKKAETSGPSSDDVKSSMFVESRSGRTEDTDDSEETEEKDGQDHPDEESDEGKEEAKDEKDDSKNDSSAEEESDAGEAFEDLKESSGDGDRNKEDSVKNAKPGKEKRETESRKTTAGKVQAERRLENEPEFNLTDIIPINGKSITIFCLSAAIIIMILLVIFLPAFRVRNCVVEGNVVLTDQEILAAAGLEYDAHLMSGVSGNIFDIIRLDYGKTEERIKRENPYVEDIRITIKLPSTVEIRVKERSKVCYVKTPDGYAALDKDGIVLELSSFNSGKTVQPVICGLNITSAELGKKVKIENTNDYKKAIIVLGAILAADNASVGGKYCMFENTSEVRILPSGYIFLTIYSPSNHLVQIKLNSLENIGDDMAWLLFAFNGDGFDKITVDGALDMTGDDNIFHEYE